MRKTLIISILAILLNSGYLSAQKHISKVDNLLILPPLIEIKVIKAGNKLEIDTLLTNQVRKEILYQAKTLIPDTIKTVQFEASDLQTKEIYKAIEKMLKIGEGKFKPKAVPIPDFLINLLDSANKDYGLGIVDMGFLRTDENYSSEYTKSAQLKFFTLRVYGLYPRKSLSTMICFIMNRKQKTLSFYEKISWSERNPAETVVIRSQLHHLLMSYFLGSK